MDRKVCFMIKNNSSIKLCIALIHNENKYRNSYIRPRLNTLKKELSNDFETEIFEISKEPEVIPNGTFITLLTKFYYWKISREWIRYRELSPRIIFLDVVALIRLLILTFIHRKRENTRCVNDLFVTDKHVRAWNNFLEKEADFLICFEDDAVFHKDSISKLKTFLREIKKNKNKPIYLDFAGGCDFKTLGVDKLEFKRDKYHRYYRKPVTNTVCSYMLSRPSAQIISLSLLKHPWLRLIAPDWLLNKIFILTLIKYTYICYHAYPTIFNHGSITGDYPSLHLKD